MTGSSPEQHGDAVPPDTEPEIVDAEIVEVPAVPDPLTAPPPAVPAPDYSDSGVPSFDYVRDKIEGRVASSIGAAELAGETRQGRSLAEQEEERAKKAAEKLAEIRRSLGQG